MDGDSASLGEVCTLISALSRTPLKQCFAITGSINQFGEVQAVGGVNEKIEGFFRLCEARGLTGEQGVIIPRANVTTLMLDERVLQAVRAGQFHVYAVREVDEALALLVGKPVGAQDEKGRFPKGSVNDLVVARLQEISELGMEEDDKEKDKPAEKRPSWRRTRPRRRRTEPGALSEPVEGGAGKPRPRAFQPCGQVPAGAMRNLAAGVGSKLGTPVRMPPCRVTSASSALVWG